MAATNLGKVSIHGEGDWSASAAYSKLALVSYDGGSYMARRDVPAGTPTENKIFWMPITAASNIAGLEFVTPEMFGAKGDGIADDTEAVQAAVNLGAAEKKPIVLTAKYKTSNAIEIITDYTNIIGRGEIVYVGIDAAIKIKASYCHVFLMSIKSSGTGILFVAKSSVRGEGFNEVSVDFADCEGSCFKLDGNTAGILYNKLVCRVAKSNGYVFHFDCHAASYIGETLIDCQSVKRGTWVIYADGYHLNDSNVNDANINGIKTISLGMEGVSNGIYGRNIHGCVFDNLRFIEMVDADGGKFAELTDDSHGNVFRSAVNLRRSAIVVDSLTSIYYNDFNIPLKSDNGVILCFGARANKYGLHSYYDHQAFVNITGSSPRIFRCDEYKRMLPTFFTIGRTGDEDGPVKILLSDAYGYDGISKIYLRMTAGVNYRCAVYDHYKRLIYDFTQTAENGIYSIVFSKVNDSAYSAAVFKEDYTTVISTIDMSPNPDPDPDL